jgi:pimeloyl-ACP methyl ester carboxylesterase
MHSLALGIATAATMFAAATAIAQTRLVTEEMMVKSPDPGIEIYVRNKRPADMTTFRPERTVLYVHGATYPASTAFDLKLDGMSWMDYIATRGYDVYLLDLRGYGNSTRPKEMSEDPNANPPIVRGDTAVKDIGTVVDFILARRNIPRVNLIGWSWGTVTMSTYTTQNPGKVERLILYAPGWIRQTASLVQAGSGPLGAYRKVTREQAMQRWMTGVPDDKKATLIPNGWFDAWADRLGRPIPKVRRQIRRISAHRTASFKTARITGPPGRPTTIRPRSLCRRCWCRPNGTATCRPTWRRRCFRCSSARPASAT